MTQSTTRALRRNLVRLLVALIPLLVLAATRDSSPSLADETPGPGASRPGPASSPDQMAVAHMVPGFGGYFLDVDGAPSVYLTNALERPLAQIALRAFLESRGFTERDLRVLTARFRYAQLDTWFRLARPSVRTVDGLVFGKVDEKLNRLRYEVTSAMAGAQVMGALTALDIPRSAVVIELVSIAPSALAE